MMVHRIWRLIVLVSFMPLVCQADTFAGQRNLQIDAADLAFLGDLGIDVTISEWSELDGGSRIKFDVRPEFDSEDKRIEVVLFGAKKEVIAVIQDDFLRSGTSFSMLIVEGHMLKFRMVLSPDRDSKYYEIVF